MDPMDPTTPDLADDDVSDIPSSAAPDDEVRIFRVPNKLRDKLLNGKGDLAIDLVAKAESNLDFMRPRCLNIISDRIDQIITAYGQANRVGDEPFDKLYTLSAQIVDVSTPVAELEIDRVAYSLCELVDRCEGLGQWDWPSVDVHIDALVLLRQDGGSLPPEARQVIFRGLDKLNQRLPSHADSMAAKARDADDTPPETVN
jgi:hypothetical protein